MGRLIPLLMVATLALPVALAKIPWGAADGAYPHGLVAEFRGSTGEITDTSRAGRPAQVINQASGTVGSTGWAEFNGTARWWTLGGQWSHHDATGYNSPNPGSGGHVQGIATDGTTWLYTWSNEAFEVPRNQNGGSKGSSWTDPDGLHFGDPAYNADLNVWVVPLSDCNYNSANSNAVVHLKMDMTLHSRINLPTPATSHCFNAVAYHGGNYFFAEAAGTGVPSSPQKRNVHEYSTNGTFVATHTINEDTGESNNPVGWNGIERIGDYWFLANDEVRDTPAHVRVYDANWNYYYSFNTFYGMVQGIGHDSVNDEILHAYESGDDLYKYPAGSFTATPPVGDVALGKADQYTICTLFEVGGGAGTRRFLVESTGGDQHWNYSLGVESDNKVAAGMGRLATLGGPYLSQIKTSWTVVNTDYYFVAVTYSLSDDDKLRLYVQRLGPSVTRETSTTLIGTSATIVYIDPAARGINFGTYRAGTARWFNGDVFALQFYDRALTQAEIDRIGQRMIHEAELSGGM